MLKPEYLFLQTTRLKVSEGWSHQGEELCFMFPKLGVGKLSLGTLEQPLLPGDVVVVNGRSGARPSITALEEMILLSFAVSFEHLFPLFASPEVSLLQEVTQTFQDFRYYSAFSPLAQECHRLLHEVPPQFDLDHRGQLLRVVAAILALEFKNARQRHRDGTGFEEQLARAFERLSSIDILSLSVSDLARHFNCSRRHLNRLFRQHLGVSAAALRMEMRLLRAVSLLRNRGARVVDVAEQCGFNHLGLFNACFRRRFGASPGEWRKTSLATRGASPPTLQADAQCPIQQVGLCPRVQQAAPITEAGDSATRFGPFRGNGGSKSHKTTSRRLGKSTAPSPSQRRNGKARFTTASANTVAFPPHDEQPGKP